MPVAFIVTLRVKPGQEQRSLDLLTPVFDAMRHERSFINAVLLRGSADPTRFMLYETWAELEELVDVQLQRGCRRAGAGRTAAIHANRLTFPPCPRKWRACRVFIPAVPRPRERRC